ncbi:MAG: hypothetical protein R2709_15460 [Marmoricola sp.]
MLRPGLLRGWSSSFLCPGWGWFPIVVGGLGGLVVGFIFGRCDQPDLTMEAGGDVPVHVLGGGQRDVVDRLPSTRQTPSPAGPM